MGMFLNSIEPYDKYKTITKGLYFVDKTELLEELIPALEQEQRFFCITRPRRFGKTVMANMIASFFEKSEGGSDIFDRLKISEYPKYKEHLNKHDVVYIDFSEMPKECDSYKKYISRIEEGIYYDLREKYSDLYLKQEDAIWDIFSKIFNETKKKFIFVPSGITFCKFSFFGPCISIFNIFSYGFSINSFTSINLTSGINPLLFLKYKDTIVCLICSSVISSCGVYSTISFFSFLFFTTKYTPVIIPIIKIIKIKIIIILFQSNILFSPFSFFNFYARQVYFRTNVIQINI